MRALTFIFLALLVAQSLLYRSKGLKSWFASALILSAIITAGLGVAWFMLGLAFRLVPVIITLALVGLAIYGFYYVKRELAKG